LEEYWELKLTQEILKQEMGIKTIGWSAKYNVLDYQFDVHDGIDHCLLEKLD